MIEKVNPSHPDKVADRIAGAIVDYAYEIKKDPKIAVEILIGHNLCTIIIESDVDFEKEENKEVVRRIVRRISGLDDIECVFKFVKQDENLAKNQEDKIKSGDNGIFKGVPLTQEEKEISKIIRRLYEKYPTDGKFILTDDTFIACQSNASKEELEKFLEGTREKLVINPLGDWTGGVNVDSGATNRKLGSDMARSLTGGGLHGKDLSKGDVAINIYAFLKAQETGKDVEIFCAIGDEKVDGKDYIEIVQIAEKYIRDLGGFEKFAEYGLY